MKSHAAGKTRVVPVSPIDYATLVAKLTEKERANLERYASAFEEKLGPEIAQRFRRLVSVLMTLASSNPKISSPCTIQFFIPDGKYRKQVFALRGNPDDGSFTLYAPDILADAIRAGLLGKTKRPDAPNVYPLANSAETLTIDSLDGKTPNPEPHYKDMTGWNRKAIRITLLPTATPAQIAAVEQLCALAASDWVPATE